MAAKRTATFVSWEYMLSVEGERRVLIKMKTALKSSCDLSDTVVNSCEIFTHLTLNGLKNNTNYYFVTDLHIWIKWGLDFVELHACYKIRCLLQLLCTVQKCLHSTVI